MENVFMFGLKQFKATCLAKYANNYASKDDWKNGGVFLKRDHSKHLYFLGKDNIPFTIIWPAKLWIKSCKQRIN